MELKSKRVLVVGLARTGVATALFCAARGATRDGDRIAHRECRSARRWRNLRAAGVTLELGGQSTRLLLEQDLIVPSPGRAGGFSAVAGGRARAAVTMWSEIELAYRFLEGRLVGITGSNGKTTTTSLVEHILQTAGFPTIVGGQYRDAADFAGGVDQADTIR